MNKEKTQQILNELKSSNFVLKSLEVAGNRYRYEHIPHDLDRKVLFRLQLLQEELTKILYSFYLGDVDKDYSESNISLEEKIEFYNSKKGKAPFENQEPYFSFGYTLSEFTDLIDDNDGLT